MALPFDVDPHEGEAVKGASVPPGQFLIYRSGYPARADPWEVQCLLGSTRPRVIRGYGGWGQSQREGRRAVSSFDGAETVAYSIELLLANDRPRLPFGLGPRRVPVSEQMRSLERLAGFDRHNDTPPPPVQWVANVAHDADNSSKTEWVCEGLEWGESNASDRGTLLWQRATIVLGVLEDPTIPNLDPAQAFPRRELKVGWDLRDFARKYLGDAKRWKDVAELNRDNPRCPTSPAFKPKREVWLLTPPREPKSKRAKRGK